MFRGRLYFAFVRLREGSRDPEETISTRARARARARVRVRALLRVSADVCVRAREDARVQLQGSGGGRTRMLQLVVVDQWLLAPCLAAIRRRLQGERDQRDQCV